MSTINQEVALDEVSKKFEAHLNVENNFRIIFSGKYGTGKSFFLNKYFDLRNDKYNKFLISPVNYVVSNNDDIFELIKVDIIKQLFFKDHIKPLTKKQKEKIVTALQMAHEKPFVVAKHIASMFKKVNPFFDVADSFLDGMFKLSEEFKKYEKELQSQVDLDVEHLEKFISGFTNKTGNIFEDDFITTTINRQLENIRDEGKENVLIIDDLDRIDPEHIFRILNILSAHNNYWDRENKFKFDRIILVCDINNIQKTFHHRYGNDVDFSGYIDKFYSTDIFYFSNKDAIISHVHNVIGKELSVEGKSFLSFIILVFFEKGTLNLRRILKSGVTLKPQNVCLSIRSYTGDKALNPFLSIGGSVKVMSEDFEILQVLKLLSMIWGDFTSLKSDIAKSVSDSSSFSFENKDKVMKYLILPYHLMQNADSNSLYHTIRNKTSRYAEVEYPLITLFGRNYRILLKWSAATHYDPNQSFFHQSKTSEISDTGGHSGVRNSVIFVALNDIIDTFNQRRYLHHLGL